MQLDQWSAIIDSILDQLDVQLQKLYVRLINYRNSRNAQSSQQADGQKLEVAELPFSLREIKQTAGRSCWLFLALTVVWLLGYIGVSSGWLLLVFLVYVRKRVLDDARHEEQRSMRSAYLIGSPEQTEAARDEFLARLGDVPSWVFFSESERAEWLNTVIGRIWPYFNKFVAQFILTNFAEQLRKETPFSLEFRKVDIGDEPLHISSVRSYNMANMARDEAIFDIEVLYCGDAEFKVSAKALRVGIADLKLRGTLRVLIKPLLPVMPFVGCVTVAFINRPEFDFNLTEAAEIAEKLGLHRAIRSAVFNVIDSQLVLPNRMPLPMPLPLTPYKAAAKINEAYLKRPMPVGVLRVKVVEAKDLPTTDIAIGDMAKCDGFCGLSVGNQYGKTRVIQNQSCPTWKESFDFTIVEKHGQPVQITVYDADAFGKKQRVGKVKAIDSSDVASAANNVIDKWFHIFDTTRGKLHLRLHYFNLSDDPADLMPPGACDSDPENTAPSSSTGLRGLVAGANILALAAGVTVNTSRKSSNSHSRHRHRTTSARHTALVYINVHSAENLPNYSRDSEPDAKVKLLIEGQPAETQAKRGLNVDWDEVFHFLVEDPMEAVLVLQVVDRKHDSKPMAIGSVKLKAVRDEPAMIWNKPVVLEHRLQSGTQETRLNITVALRAMTTRKLDARAVADANDRFFLYGSTTLPNSQQQQQQNPLGSQKKSKKSSLNSSRSSNASFRGSVSASSSSSRMSVANAPPVDAVDASDGGLLMHPLQPNVFSSDTLSITASEALSDATIRATDSAGDVVVLRSASLLNRRAVTTEPSRPAQLDDSQVEATDFGMHSLGKIKLTFRYVPQRTSLMVVVHRCQNLVACDTEKNSSDPYVMLKLVAPGPVIGRLQRTSVVKNNLNPTYDQSYSLPLPSSDVVNALLLVSVKHRRSVVHAKMRKHIGDVALRLRDFGVSQSLSCTAWFDLQPRVPVQSRVSLRHHSLSQQNLHHNYQRAASMPPTKTKEF